ncbi:proline-rich protein 29 isoform X1 [Lepidochelys kempii]|uniref:proline-rich protein 29 isoform X1 n=1 Tax=Lepidochelys kempii TaxID=8472 RepID=UPI003C6F0F38
MPPRARRSPVWSNGEVQDLISVCGEEAVQSQLRSSRRNYDTFGQISRDMMERGHDWDAQQCRVKVKELQNAYRKACKANCHSGAAPTTCRFYKELDAILGGDSTSTLSTTMDISEPSSTRQEEEESGSEGAEEEGNSPASLGACSQELFSSQEEGSQSQRLVLGEGQTPEDMPDATLRSQPSLLSTAERLQRIRKRPRRRKEDMLHEVMQQSLNENKKAQEWQESERRVRRQNADRQHQSTERLLSIMERQADSIQALVAMQAKHYHTPAHSPCPKTLSLVPPYHLQPTFPNIWVLIATSCFQHLELHHPALQTTTPTHRAQPPSPCSRASPHCTALQTGRLSMRTGHTQICD